MGSTGGLCLRRLDVIVVTVEVPLSLLRVEEFLLALVLSMALLAESILSSDSNCWHQDGLSSQRRDVSCILFQRPEASRVPREHCTFPQPLCWDSDWRKEVGREALMALMRPEGYYESLGL